MDRDTQTEETHSRQKEGPGQDSEVGMSMACAESGLGCALLT